MPATTGVHDELSRVRHDLAIPLTTIVGRAQLLSRRVQRSSSLSPAEQAVFLLGLGAIEEAVYAAATVIDDLGEPQRRRVAPDPRGD